MSKINITLSINNDETRCNSENNWYAVLRAFVTINGKRLHEFLSSDEEDIVFDLKFRKDNYTDEFSFEVLDPLRGARDYAVLSALMKAVGVNLCDYLDGVGVKVTKLMDSCAELNENLNLFEETFNG